MLSMCQNFKILHQIILENIYIDNDGTAQFEFNDNDLFSGHYIVVTIDNRGKLIDAEI